MPPERNPRIRLVAIPDGALLVVRGDELDESVLRADATRFKRRFDEWGRFGVSGFLAESDIEVDVLCETRLEQFAQIVIFERSKLSSAGIDVVPTFRRPHVTLAHLDLDALVSGLLTCEHRQVANPHFDIRGNPS